MKHSKNGKNESLSALTNELADPFAKALATFVREARSSGEDGSLIEKMRSSARLRDAGQKHIEMLRKEYAELERLGKLESMDFRDLPIPRPPMTLRRLARQKGMTQKELAKKAGMDAAMVSRVLKNPDRSSVATIKRIVHALGARMTDVDLEAA